MSYQVNLFRKPPVIGEVVSRAEYREILLARMAAGDLYASETLAMVRKADMALDVLRQMQNGTKVFCRTNGNRFVRNAVK